MFVFRRILKSGIVENRELGNKYSYIHKGESPEQFEELTKEFDQKNIEGCYGLVISENSRKHFVTPDEQCFIMTDKGSTFAKL